MNNEQEREEERERERERKERDRERHTKRERDTKRERETHKEREAPGASRARTAAQTRHANPRARLFFVLIMMTSDFFFNLALERLPKPVASAMIEHTLTNPAGCSRGEGEQGH